MFSATKQTLRFFRQNMETPAEYAARPGFGPWRWCARHAGKLVSDENDGVADSELAVHDFAIRPSHAHDFRRAKNLLVEIHGAARVFARQAWDNGMIPYREDR